MEEQGSTDWVPWVLSFLGAIGGLGAAAVTWWFQFRNRYRTDQKAKRKAEAEQLEEMAIPYRQAFREQQKELEKTKGGLEKLQAEHIDALVRVARLEADNVNCQATNSKLLSENARVAGELTQTQTDLRRLQEEVARIMGRERGEAGRRDTDGDGSQGRHADPETVEE